MDWKKLIGNIAPVLGGSLGGPFGAMAGSWLADKLGVDVDNLEATVNSATPDTLLKIKELDNQFAIDMKKLGLDQKKLHADDRANARKMATNTTLTPQIVLACIFVMGFVGILYTVFSGGIELSNQMSDMANYLLGILSAGLVQIMNFFYGSSVGSKEKNNLIR